VKVTLLYIDGCGHWRLGHERIRAALNQTGADSDQVSLVKITTPEDARGWQFRGSPTFLVDGRDPFPPSNSQVGLSCRIYQTTTGPSDVPTVAELVQALSSRPCHG